MRLTQWRPLNEIERFFDDEDWTLMVPPKFMSATAIDVYEKDGNLMAEADIVGVKPEDVEVTVEDNVLTIHGESAQEEEEKKREEKKQGNQDYHNLEFCYCKNAKIKSFVDAA